MVLSSRADPSERKCPDCGHEFSYPSELRRHSERCKVKRAKQAGAAALTGRYGNGARQTMHRAYGCVCAGSRRATSRKSARLCRRSRGTCEYVPRPAGLILRCLEQRLMLLLFLRWVQKDNRARLETFCRTNGLEFKAVQRWAYRYRPTPPSSPAAAPRPKRKQAPIPTDRATPEIAAPPAASGAALSGDTKTVEPPAKRAKTTDSSEVRAAPVVSPFRCLIPNSLFCRRLSADQHNRH